MKKREQNGDGVSERKDGEQLERLCPSRSIIGVKTIVGKTSSKSLQLQHARGLSPVDRSS